MNFLANPAYRQMMPAKTQPVRFFRRGRGNWKAPGECFPPPRMSFVKLLIFLNPCHSNVCFLFVLMYSKLPEVFIRY